MRLTDYETPEAARARLEDLDTVETRDLFFWDLEDGRPAPKFLINHRLLYNTTARDPIVPATNQYAVLSHREAFGRIIDMVMGSLPSLPVPRVYVEDLGNTARLWLLFPTGGEEEQIIGVRITNSYDMSVSLQGDLVIWMLPADYAIVLSRTQDLGLPPLALPHRAKAFEHLEERVRAFIAAALGGESWLAVERLESEASGIPVRFSSAVEKSELMERVKFGKKLGGRIAAQVPDSLSRWALFCIMAEAAHKEDLSPLMREVIREKIEAVLRG